MRLVFRSSRSVAKWLRENMLSAALRPSEPQGDAIQDHDAQDRDRHENPIRRGMRSTIHPYETWARLNDLWWMLLDC